MDRPNIRVIQGRQDNPNLPAGNVDAVLVANTYHELAPPGPVFDCIFRALSSGGRLVVVDRYPGSIAKEVPEIEAPHHGAFPAFAENVIRRSGFQIVSRDDRFIDWPGEQSWWLVVAAKP